MTVAVTSKYNATYCMNTEDYLHTDFSLVCKNSLRKQVGLGDVYQTGMTMSTVKHGNGKLHNF